VATLREERKHCGRYGEDEEGGGTSVAVKQEGRLLEGESLTCGPQRGQKGGEDKVPQGSSKTGGKASRR
jgi:hypothetical protein